MKSTGNELRDKMIAEAIQAARDHGEPITFENVKRRLPDDFKLRPSEVTEFHQSAEPVDVEFTEVPEPEPVAPVAAEPAEPVKPLAQRIAEAEAEVTRTAQTLADIRTAVILGQRRLATANAAAARAISQFQSGLAPFTQNHLIRAHLASEQEHRRAVAAGEVAPRGRGRPRTLSAVDAIGQARADSANMRFGRQYARGGFPASARGQSVKAPSER